MIVVSIIIFSLNYLNICLLEALVVDHTVYAGVFFNVSTPELQYNKTLSWLQASNLFTYGLALPSMAGDKILLTGRHGIHYQLSVVSPKLWSHTLSNNKCNRVSESGIMAIINVTKRNVSALSVIERIRLLSTIAREAGLSELQHVALTTPKTILFTSFLPQSSERDSLCFVWIELCGYRDIDQSSVKLEKIAKHIDKFVGKVNWFLVPFSMLLNSRVLKQRHKRFSEQEKFYNVVNTLPDLKINVMQIMNYVIPPSVFRAFLYPYDISVFRIVNNSRIILKHDQTSWIKFTPSTRNIRFQPTLNDNGINQLHICTNSTVRNESCVSLQIMIATLTPQVYQIFIRKNIDDYIVNYTLPLVWFRSHKAIKESQIQIISAKARIPVVWGSYNRLLFLNLSSIEGTVLELMVDVMVSNQTFVQIELMRPLISLAKANAILYHFQTTIRWLHFPFSNPKILLYEFTKVLQNMASKISQLSDKFLDVRKVTILPLHIYGDQFSSIHIQNETLEFDWTFSENSDLPKSCTVEVGLIMKAFTKVPMKSFLFLNTSLVKSNTNSGCGSIIHKRTTTLPTVSRHSTTMWSNATETTINQIDFNSKPMSIPNKTLSVECGKIFQYSLPSAISGIRNLKIIPVLFTGPQPDWITTSADNTRIYGVIAKNRCPKKEFRFKMIGLNSQLRTSVEMNLIVDVISSTQTTDHKFQIELVYINTRPFQILLLINAIRHLTEYIETACQGIIECNFNLSLLGFTIKHEESTMHVSLGVFENSTSCPQPLGIFLRSQIEKSFQTSDNPNPKLYWIFSRYGLGQLTHSSLLLTGLCHNKKIFPPDLGQKVVFNNIPTFVSLKPFIEFYNHSVEFLLEDRSRNSNQLDNYSQWMRIGNDSLTLFILPTTEHVRSNPYIVELSVYPPRKHRILLPRIAVEVRNLMHHPSFYPFIRELNHQISIDINTDQALVDTSLPLIPTLELCQRIDRYIRPGCIDVSKNDCGTDILVFVNSISDIPDGSSINYKLSSLKILTAEYSGFNDPQNKKMKCPFKSLAEMERQLKNALLEYRQTNTDNKSWTLEVVKVLYMGPCVHTETAYVRENNEIMPKQINVPKEKKVYFESTQQMFLMATVIPACSFIFITLLLGVATACLLNRRSRKKNLINSATLKVQRYPPVIFQSEVDAYSPPSKPLILQNEKPPQPLPDDEDEENDILIQNIQSMKFYRSTI